MASGNTTITATITRISANGFQTHEDPGRWFNLSKFATPAPTIPPIGTECQVTVDNAGFVRAIEVISEQQPTDAAEMPRDAPAAPRRPSAMATSIDVRIAALEAAAAFLAGDPDAKSADVLAVAERFEGWLAR